MEGVLANSCARRFSAYPCYLATLFLCYFLAFPRQGFSQYYITGQDPASVRWRQIKAEKFRLIYPETSERQAQYLAHVMDQVVQAGRLTQDAGMPRIPVVLHAQSAISNGLTVWAPRRIELYPCPPREGYPEEWLEQLAVHEYRHAIQLGRVNRGFSRALSYIFGEQITGGILGLFLPAWHLEGDATVAETALTNTGRGRSPRFESDLRAQVLEKGIQSYNQATLGSYRTYVPDAYSLGYYLAGQARVTYGRGAWDEAIGRVGKYPFMVVPFNSGIRSTTGRWKAALYRESLGILDSAWQRQRAETPLIQPRQITHRDPSSYTYYRHPVPLNDTIVVAERISLDGVARFVRIDRITGEEWVILTPGSYHEGSLSVGGKYLAWSAPEPDVRWGNRSYSVIWIYDLEAQKKIRLTRKTRYFSPAVSPDGTQVALITYTNENECSVGILQLPGGKFTGSFPSPGNGRAGQPNWSHDSRLLVMTSVSETGNSIVQLNPANGEFKTLVPAGFRELGRPAFLDSNRIVYSAGHTGIESLYSTDTITHDTWLIGAGPFGTYDPAIIPGMKSIVCSDHTSDGPMIGEIDLEKHRWIPLHRLKNHRYPLDSLLALQEMWNLQDSLLRKGVHGMLRTTVSDTSRNRSGLFPFASRPYRKGLNLFNVHSWAPLSFDINNLNFQPGLMVLSQNTLGSMIARAGWEYNAVERSGKFYAGFDYRGFFPVVTLRVEAGNRSSFYRVAATGTRHRFTWRENVVKAEISLPLNLSRGLFTRSLRTAAGITFTEVIHHTGTPESFLSGWIRSYDFRLSFSQHRRSVARDAGPRFGQAADIRYRYSPAGANSLGSIFAATVDLYFPGILRHQSIRIGSSYQRRYGADPIAYVYSDLVNYPRGWHEGGDERLAGFSFNYKFPLVSPDLSLGSVIYVKRFKLNLFYDYSQGSGKGHTDVYRSAGGELMTDLHLLRIVTPMEFGVRSIYYPGSGRWGFEFLYSISY